MNEYNPKRVILARNMRGISQGELAARISAPNQAILSNIETGKLELTDEYIGRIAEVLKFPATFFKKNNSWTRISKFYYRKRNAFPAKEIVPLEAKIDLLREVYVELLNAVNVEFKELPKIPVTEKNSPEDIARMFRLFLGLNDDPIENFVSLIEKLGIPVVYFDVPSDKFSGMTVQTDINMPLIVINQNMPNDHKKFTLAHEIGHLIMHIPFSEDPAFYERLEDLETVEKEADRFAGAFLVPAATARYTFRPFTYSKLTDLKIYWKVSKQSLIYRAKDLKIIDESKFRSLFIELSRYGERKVEKIQVPLDKPVLLNKIIDVHLNQLGFTMKQLAETVAALEEPDFLALFNIGRPNLRVVID